MDTLTSIEEVDKYYKENGRLVSYQLYNMIQGSKSYPNLFNHKNVDVLKYLLEKEELFSVLLLRNAKHLCNSIGDLVQFLTEHERIYDILRRNPSYALDDIVTREYLDLFKDVRRWCDPTIIIMDDYEEYTKLLEDYKGVWNSRCNEEFMIHIAKSPSITIFRRIWDVVGHNISKDRMIHIVLYYSIVPEILDIVGMNYFAIPEDEYGYFQYNWKMKDMSINIIKHLYSIRRPTKSTFERMIGSSLEIGRQDIYEYLISIAPYDCNVIASVAEYASVQVLDVYMKHMKLTQSCINSLWEKAIKNEDLDLVKFLYKNVTEPTIIIDLGDGECSKYIRKKQKCNIM